MVAYDGQRQAFEGLNNAGIGKSDILVILNDNNMAIDANVRCLKEYLLDITTSKTLTDLKTGVLESALEYSVKLGTNARHIAAQIEAGAKSTILDRSNLF